VSTGEAPLTGRGLLRSAVPPRAISLVLLVAGLVMAAVGTGRGVFFVADQPPARLRFLLENIDSGEGAPRPQRAFAGRNAGQLPAVVEATLSVLLLLAAAALAVAVVVSVIRGLVGVRRLLLAPSRGGRPAAAVEEAEGTEEEATEPLRQRLARSLDVALPALESAAEPREAVIACYVGMEGALRDLGTVRRPAETQTELLSRVLVEQSVPRVDAARLTDLFQTARFGRAPVDERMRTDAMRSLTRVRDALGSR